MFRLWPRSLLTCERSTTAFLDKQCVLYFFGELQESFSIWLILLGWFPTTFSLKSFTMCFCLRIPRDLQACASYVESFVSAFRKCFEALDGRVRPSNSWSQSFWKSDLSQHEASEHIKARRHPFWRVGGTRALAHSIYNMLYSILKYTESASLLWEEAGGGEKARRGQEELTQNCCLYPHHLLIQSTHSSICSILNREKLLHMTYFRKSS